MSRCLDFDSVHTVLAAARLRLARPGALIFLDYDGTLTPIAARPEQARLSGWARSLLRRLAAQPACHVAVVSGRSLLELRGMVGLSEVAYAGNHGLELYWPGRGGGEEWEHPDARAFRTDLELLRAQLPLDNWPGVWVEDKFLTLTVHYRQVDPALVPEVTAALAGLVEPRERSLSLRSGKMSYEVRPRLDWDKGQAVLKLAEVLSPGGDWGLFYAGDDATDEDAFKVVGPEGLGVLVGERRESFADYCLSDWRALLELLAALADTPPWQG